MLDQPSADSDTRRQRHPQMLQTARQLMISCRPSGSAARSNREGSADRCIDRSPTRHRHGWEWCNDGARTAIRTAARKVPGSGRLPLTDFIHIRGLESELGNYTALQNSNSA